MTWKRRRACEGLFCFFSEFFVFSALFFRLRGSSQMRQMYPVVADEMWLSTFKHCECNSEIRVMLQENPPPFFFSKVLAIINVSQSSAQEWLDQKTDSAVCATATEIGSAIAGPFFAVLIPYSKELLAYTVLCLLWFTYDITASKRDTREE